MAFGPALMAASTTMQFLGNIYQGEAAGSEFNQAADAARRNAELARQQGNAREEMVRADSARKLGIQRAAAAQSGFDPSSGSLLDLQADSASQLELDALTARYQSRLESIGFENQASSLHAKAKAARTTGYLNAFGSLFQNGANYFGNPKVSAQIDLPSRHGDFVRSERASPYYGG